MRLRQKSEVPDDQLEAYLSIQPGMVLYGFCCGHFGRDSFGDKIVVEKTPQYITVREESGALNESRDMTRFDNAWNDLVESSNAALAEMESDDGNA